MPIVCWLPTFIQDRKLEEELGATNTFLSQTWRQGHMESEHTDLTRKTPFRDKGIYMHSLAFGIQSVVQYYALTSFSPIQAPISRVSRCQMSVY